MACHYSGAGGTRQSAGRRQRIKPQKGYGLKRGLERWRKKLRCVTTQLESQNNWNASVPRPVREKIRSESTGDQSFHNQPKLTREYFTSRKRYVTTTPLYESVMESGVPNVLITSANVVFPGTMKATSLCVRAVFRVMRTTLHPAKVVQIIVKRRMEQSQDNESFISLSKGPESKLHSFRALR
jgi:hypothetical protein